MVFQEHVTRADQIDDELVALARLEQLRTVRAIAIPYAQNSLTYVDGPSIRIDIDQLSHEIGVDRIGSRVQHHLDRPCDLQLLAERSRRIDQHVVAILDAALVARAGDRRRAATVIPARAGYGILRVITIPVRCGILGRRVPGKATVAVAGVGVTGAGQIHLAILCASQGKLVLLPPAFLPHDEQRHGRLRSDAVGGALQPIVEPRQLEDFAFQVRSGSEIQVAGLLRDTVLPRTDDHVALLSSRRRLPALAETYVPM